MENTKNVIRHYILSTHLQGEPSEMLRDDTPLVTSGVLDSLATWNLVTFIEAQFGVSLSVHDTAVERFDCINDMVATIDAKRSTPLPSSR